MFEVGQRVRLITEKEYFQLTRDPWGFRPRTPEHQRTGAIHHLSRDGEGAFIQRDGIKFPDFFLFHEFRREDAPEEL